jgi:ABC-2 type transport system ATP-binding protein
MDMVRFDGVVKEYPQGLFGLGRLRALDGVSLAVAPGEVVGLVGPNRAGKTTLVKLLLSLCRPTDGTVFRLGKPATDRSTLARVGYVHENPALPRYLTATSLLHYFGAMTYMSEPDVRKRAPALLERVGLADRAHEPIARFSKGMVQRLGLAQALLNEPDLLVLDEPNEGLDMIGRELVRDVVAEQRKKGRSVLFVSHVLSEMERICDRIAILVAGRLRFLGDLDALLVHRDGGEPLSLEEAVKAYYCSAPRESCAVEALT